MGTGVVRKGGGLLQYGTLYRTRHGETPERNSCPDGKIVCYEQRTDGFVCAAFPAEGGSLTTCSWHFEGDNLLLNADPGMNGNIRIGLAEADGTPVKGFTIEDCMPVESNSTDCPVQWTGGRSLFPRERPLRIRIEGASARLFGLKVT